MSPACIPFPLIAVLTLGALHAPAAAQAVPQATLELRSDTPCALQVNGQPQGTVAGPQALRVAVKPGRTTLVCRSTEGPPLATETSLELKADETVSRILRLRWAEVAPDRLLDRRSGLQWTRSDNGSDVDWAAAKAWCSARGEGWRLPTRAELEGLLQSGAPGETAPCRGAQCKVPGLFQLTSYWQWSGEAGSDGSDARGKAWYLYLHTGHPQSSPVTFSLNARALCVRAPER